MSVKKVRLSAKISCAFRELGEFGESERQDAQGADARFHHPNVPRFLPYFFRRAERSTGELLVFMLQGWYIVHVLKSTLGFYKGQVLQL